MMGNDARARQLLGEAERKMRDAIAKERDADTYEKMVNRYFL